jgi:hypothetical protein
MAVRGFVNPKTLLHVHPSHALPLPPDEVVHYRDEERTEAFPIQQFLSFVEQYHRSTLGTRVHDASIGWSEGMQTSTFVDWTKGVGTAVIDRLPLTFLIFLS